MVVPTPLAGLVPNTQSQLLNQAQALQIGERYDHNLTLCSHRSYLNDVGLLLRLFKIQNSQYVLCADVMPGP